MISNWSLLTGHVCSWSTFSVTLSVILLVLSCWWFIGVCVEGSSDKRSVRELAASLNKNSSDKKSEPSKKRLHLVHFLIAWSYLASWVLWSLAVVQTIFRWKELLQFFYISFNCHQTVVFLPILSFFLVLLDNKVPALNCQKKQLLMWL